MSKRLERAALGLIVLLFAGLSIVGITWGLPTRRIDPYLFGHDPPWPGEKIYRLARAQEKFSPIRGADVDVDPLVGASKEPIPLTTTEEDVAKIYLRYRLYTHQPDEMITMMALAGMEPGRLNLDPRLYQYGGLFIYPVGALIRACGILGLIDVRSDLIYYLDHPDAFGRFYVVARAYAAAWGLIGVCVVFLIGRRLGGSRAGLLAALLFTLMPVVVCMAHEGKPHLPGAVLMLAAVLFAMRAGSREPHRNRDWLWMCVCCGAGLGMVLSSLPILVLIPVCALLDARRARIGAVGQPSNLKPARPAWVVPAMKRSAAGLAVAMLVYMITNPYIVINAVGNREVLRSNFGNSLAMYEVARIGEGFVRVMELTVEGATLPVVALGLVALVVGIARRSGAMIPLAVTAGVFFVQFVLIGAGKPAEYGRFGIFTNTALAIGAAGILTHRWGKLRIVVNCVTTAVATLWIAFCGGLYLMNFHIDTTMDNSRTAHPRWLLEQTPARDVAHRGDRIAVVAEPAPYGCPPMNFARTDVVLVSDLARARAATTREQAFLIRAVERFPGSPYPGLMGIRLLARSILDRELGTLPGFGPFIHAWDPETPISWANKPIVGEPLIPVLR